MAPAFLPSSVLSHRHNPNFYTSKPYSSTRAITEQPSSQSPTPLLTSLRIHLSTLAHSFRKLEAQTRPGSLPSTSANRYQSLPSSAKSPSQMLGRLSPGCEGTKAVFPRCNFACTPCYHSKDANHIRTDPFHTVTEIARQMQTLHRIRGPTGHCQLIGGEVSLLEPEDHALALQTMRFFGRIPMSFTHGDFSYDYLYRLAVKDGKRRFDRLDFAVHFDMEMRGRKGIERPINEMALTPYRQNFVAMFERLRRENGIRYYLAHNMTVQERNLPYVAEAIRQCRAMGFRLFSFQPAAQQGPQRRWVPNLRTIADDDGEMVWREIEKGMGIRLPYKLFQMGDVRCNRMSICGVLGPRGDVNARIFPLFDDLCEEDVTVRDIIIQHFGNIVLKPNLLAIKMIRTFLLKPWLIFVAVKWCLRVAQRAGGIWQILRHGMRPLTIVMHRFMDAEDVSKAWDLMEDGVPSDDPCVDDAGPRIRETMERLSACSYGMAQPDQGRVVPACVQHSIYDPMENKELAKKLPLTSPSQPATIADVKPQTFPWQGTSKMLEG